MNTASFFTRRADAERVERVPGVRRDLDAGADLAELRRLLQHHRAETLARQRQRRGEAADAAAGDDHRLLVARLHCSMLSAARPSGERGIGQRFDDFEVVEAFADHGFVGCAQSSTLKNSRDWR